MPQVPVVRARRTWIAWGNHPTKVHRILPREGDDYYTLACGRTFNVDTYAKKTRGKLHVGFWSTEWDWDSSHPYTCQACKRRNP